MRIMLSSAYARASALAIGIVSTLVLANGASAQSLLHEYEASVSGFADNSSSIGPESIHVVHESWSADVVSDPGSAGVSLAESVGYGPTAVGVNTGLFFAKMTYEFEVKGTLGLSVPIFFQFAGSAEAAADEGAFVLMRGSGTMTGPGISYVTQLCASNLPGGCTVANQETILCTGSSCNPAGSFGSVAGFGAITDNIYTITLLAVGNASDSCSGCVGLGHVTVDPYVWIDPSFAQADQFSIVVSDGVPNVQLSTISGSVPEPSTWALLSVGFVLLGFVASHKCKHASAQANKCSRAHDYVST